MYIILYIKHRKFTAQIFSGIGKIQAVAATINTMAVFIILTLGNELFSLPCTDNKTKRGVELCH